MLSPHPSPATNPTPIQVTMEQAIQQALAIAEERHQMELAAVRQEAEPEGAGCPGDRRRRPRSRQASTAHRAAFHTSRWTSCTRGWGWRGRRSSPILLEEHDADVQRAGARTTGRTRDGEGSAKEETLRGGGPACSVGLLPGYVERVVEARVRRMSDDDEEEDSDYDDEEEEMEDSDSYDNDD